MTDTEIRSILKNDSVLARRIDGDDDYSADSSSPRTSFLSTDSETLVSSTPSKRSGPGATNTGPKGVREDARAFEQSQLKTKHNPTWSQDQADIDARERWVEKRMKELSKKAAQGTPLEVVDERGYLETVESNALVIVLIANSDPESTSFTQVLSQFPARYPHFKFILLSALEAEMDEVATPAVLYYKDSNLVTTIMRVTDHFDSFERITVESTERIFRDEGIF